MSGCDSGNAAACATVAKLMQTSIANDQALATACQSPGSLACAYQKSLASLAGNNLSVVNGVTVATDAPQPTYTAPSQAAATLDNMLGSPLAGITGGGLSIRGIDTDSLLSVFSGCRSGWHRRRCGRVWSIEDRRRCFRSCKQYIYQYCYPDLLAAE
ncbi:DUF6862 domain-containing protein [Paraburkholderia antibiotica]|uniref:DUF6862 domain-containing protein n=1 Tax=Paraburkholderia antibiotica TaxID=2728839 RepID=UPI0038B30D74